MATLTRKNKWIVSIGILFCSMSISVFAQNTIELHDAEGHPVKINQLKHKWLIINYWADWCDSCREEIPELNRFYQNNQDENIIILGVNYDQLPPVDLKASIRKVGIAFPVLRENPNALWRLGEVSVLPTTFIVNPEGDVVKKIIGPNTEQSLLKVLYNRIVAKKHENKKKNIV